MGKLQARNKKKEKKRKSVRQRKEGRNLCDREARKNALWPGPVQDLGCSGAELDVGSGEVGMIRGRAEAGLDSGMAWTRVWHGCGWDGRERSGHGLA